MNQTYIANESIKLAMPVKKQTLGFIELFCLKQMQHACDAKIAIHSSKASKQSKAIEKTLNRAASFLQYTCLALVIGMEMRNLFVGHTVVVLSR